MIKPYYEESGICFYCGDALAVLRELPDETVNTCVTSPPYWGLRDYGVTGQMGLETTPDEYVQKLVAVFHEVKRVLRDDGTLWLNLGDNYCGSCSGGIEDSKGAQHGTGATSLKRDRPGKEIAGLKPKNLVGIPWRVAFALQADGWYLRSDIIWAKPNPMPESVTDRPTKSHEYIFLMAKSQKYYYDNEAIKEDTVTQDENIRDRETTRLNNVPGRSKMCGLTTNNYQLRNRRSVWTVTTKPYSEAHFATFPPDLITPCILAGCPVGGTVLDPFLGSGTTAYVSKELNRKCIGIELNEKYLQLAQKRVIQEVLPLHLHSDGGK